MPGLSWVVHLLVSSGVTHAAAVIMAVKQGWVVSNGLAHMSSSWFSLSGNW